MFPQASRSLLAIAAVSVAACGSSESPSSPFVDAGNTTGQDGGPSADASVDLPGDGTNFFIPGPYDVSSSTTTVAAETCQLPYALFTPDGLSDAPLVVLGHGFQKSSANMVGVANHLASFGVRVATPDFCHSSILDADHPANGEDAAALAGAIANGQPVVYVGHSAGGLSAAVAASLDAEAVALVGLDLTDSDGLAAAAAEDITIPTLALIGQPSSCNSDGNGDAVVNNASMALGIRIQGAGHCDFEEPTDGFCTGFCGDQDAGRLNVVKALTAAFIAWKLDIDASGEQWIAPSGSVFADLQQDGVVAPF